MSESILPRPAVEPIEGADEWIEAVAKRAKWSSDEVRVELARQQIRPPAGWGQQRHLHLDALLFAGVKTPKGGQRTPFIFTNVFDHSVTAFGTHNENDAGKSSVLKTLRWALRGRCQLQLDVRKWMRCVVLALTIEDEHLAVAFAVNNGEPAGAVMRLRQPIDFPALRLLIEGPVEDLRETPDPEAGLEVNSVFAEVGSYLKDHHATEVATFGSADDFERVMGDVMLERLGFPRVPSWQARPGNQQTHEGDGTLGELGWPTWSSALSITEPSVSVILGEDKHAVVRLLQMYIGSPWAVPVAAINARKGQVSSQLGKLQRRLQEYKDAHTGNLKELTDKLAEIDAELAQQPDPDDLADLDRRIQAAAEAGRGAAVAEAEYRRASLAYGDISRLLDDAEADVNALQEAKLTRRFWHALKPSCCPRCDTGVTEERWARERSGQCSLCDSPLELAGDEQLELDLTSSSVEQLLASGAEPDVDSIDDLVSAQLQVAQLKGHLDVVDRERDAAKRTRDEARDAWQAARSFVSEGSHVSRERWRQLSIERAVTAALIEERKSARPSAALEREIAELLREQTLLKAADAEAQKRIRGDQDDLLKQVGDKVAELARTLGIRNLESVRIVGNGHMPVTKGGENANFGGLEPGEKLRLKIALVVALMRVGEEAGVARHPGLIVIDSLGREELNPKNMIDMLAELVKLTEEVPYLQVVLTSAYGELLVKGLGPERVLLADVGKPLW
jgi:hypothetical protein